MSLFNKVFCDSPRVLFLENGSFGTNALFVVSVIYPPPDQTHVKREVYKSISISNSHVKKEVFCFPQTATGEIIVLLFDKVP